MKEFTVNGRVYRLSDIPPSISVYLRTYAGLQRKEIESADEAARVAGEVEKLLDYMLKFFEPTPVKDDRVGCFLALLEEVNRIYGESVLFRQRNLRADGEVSVASSPETVNAAGDDGGA